jgi:peptidyl-dipeptidase A
MMAAGSSQPWPDTLEAMVNTRKMDAGPMLEYFAPLEAWLDDQIAAKSIPVGWVSTFQNFME